MSQPPQQGQQTQQGQSVFDVGELQAYRSGVLELLLAAEQAGLRLDQCRLHDQMPSEQRESLRELHAAILTYHDQHQWQAQRQTSAQGVFEVVDRGGDDDAVPLWEETVYEIDVGATGVDADGLPGVEVALETLGEWRGAERDIVTEKTNQYGQTETVRDSERLFLPYGAVHAVFQQLERVHTKIGLGPSFQPQQLRSGVQR